MDKLRRALFLFVLPVLLIGCASTGIVNLTPTTVPRNANGLYQVDMEIVSDQKTLRTESITPYVVVGFEAYPMRPTRKTKNRYEALVPIGADKNSIEYHFKVDYEYDKFGKPGKGSLRSSDYKLTVK